MVPSFKRVGIPFLWAFAAIFALISSQIQFTGAKGARSSTSGANIRGRSSTPRLVAQEITEPAPPDERPFEPATNLNSSNMGFDFGQVVMGCLVFAVLVSAVGAAIPGHAKPKFGRSLNDAAGPVAQLVIPSLATGAAAQLMTGKREDDWLSFSLPPGVGKSYPPVPSRPSSKCTKDSDMAGSHLLAKDSDMNYEKLHELVIGDTYQSRDASGSWWIIKICGKNEDGSYVGVVDNAKATAWPEVWAENCRSAPVDAVFACPAALEEVRRLQISYWEQEATRAEELAQKISAETDLVVRQDMKQKALDNVQRFSDKAREEAEAMAEAKQLEMEHEAALKDTKAAVLAALEEKTRMPNEVFSQAVREAAVAEKISVNAKLKKAQVATGADAVGAEAAHEGMAWLMR